MSVTCSINSSRLDRTALSLCTHTACPAPAHSKLWVCPDSGDFTQNASVKGLIMSSWLDQKSLIHFQRHNIYHIIFPGWLCFAINRDRHTRSWTAWLADQWQLQSTGHLRNLWERTGMPQNQLLVAFHEELSEM